MRWPVFIWTWPTLRLFTARRGQRAAPFPLAKPVPTNGWPDAAGNARASRAAGQAMAKNWLPLIIPCHRVIGSDGDLHGYGAGGLGIKARLLEFERHQTGAR